VWGQGGDEVSVVMRLGRVTVEYPEVCGVRDGIRG